MGIQSSVIFKELEQAYATQAPSYATVRKWAKLFREGREDVNDDPRSGRPITKHTSANIELVRAVINNDPHSTIDDIETETVCPIY